MKKRKILIISILSVVLVIALGISLFFIFADKTNDESGSGEIYLTPIEITLEVGNEYTLTLANPNNLKVKWESLNKNIATVDEKGVVKGVSAGVAIIRAKAGNAEAKCVVTVSNLVSQPALITNESELSILLGDTFTLTSKVVLKGVNIDTKISYSIADNEIIEVVDTQEKDNRGLLFDVTGKKVGSTKLTFSAEINGVKLSKDVAITVKEDVLFNFAQNDLLVTNLPTPQVELYLSTPVENEYFVPLMDYTGLDTTKLVVDSVKVSNNTVNDPTITWRTENSEVVTVNNGNLQPVSAGSTVVYAQYGDYEQAINVEISLPEVKVKNYHFDIETVSGESELPSFVSNVVDVSVDGVNIFKSYDDANNKMICNTSDLKIGDDKLLKISNEMLSYNFDASVVTKILRTKDDLDAFRTLSKEFYKNDPYLYGGYFVLGNNIDYNASWPEFLTSATLNDYNVIIDARKGFVGTFDGRGYVINGLKTPSSALINWQGVGGVIRNLGLVNVDNGSSALCCVQGGVIENCFVSGINTNNAMDTSFITNIVGDGAVVRNCVVLVQSNVGGTAFGPIYTRLKTTNVTFENNIVVGASHYRNTSGWTGQHVDILNPNGIKTYATLSKFLSNYNVSDYANWSDVWNISESAQLPILKNTQNSIVGNTKVLSGKSFTLKALLESDFELVAPVNGITLSGNTITVADDVAFDTEFTVKATADINKDLVGQKTFKVVVPMSGDVTSLNKSIDIDLSKVRGTTDIDFSDTVIENGEIHSVEMVVVKNGVKTALVGDILPLNVEGLTNKVLSVLEDDITGIPAGIYQIKIGVMVGGDLEIYSAEIHLITKIVTTNEEFMQLSLSDSGEGGLYSAEDRSEGYFVLGTNVVFTPISGTTAFRSINGGVKFSGIFDGRGHNIDGFTTGIGYSGLFGDISGGIVRNVSFTNVVKGTGNGGVIAKKVGGLAKGGITTNAGDLPVGWYAELTNIFISGKFEDGYTGSGEYAFPSMFIEYADSLGNISPANSIIMENIIVNLTEEPVNRDGNWSAFVTLTESGYWGGGMVKTFNNIYLFGTDRVGRDMSENSLPNGWMNISDNVNVLDEFDLQQKVGGKVLGELIAENGSIWSYENGKLTMKNDGESVELF
ncbi:MAG: Ig-like domain-containing protein [Clostridia bacterium]|nr:Ig-like domain-containing protein [Clostridia bacterium]